MSYLKNRGFVCLFVCFLKDRLFLKVFPSLSVCHALVPILLWRMLGTSCHLLGLGRGSQAYILCQQQNRREKMASPSRVILGDRDQRTNCIMWKLGGTILTLDLPKPRIDPEEMCQSWSLLLLKVTQSYLGELVLLYLQFRFQSMSPHGVVCFPSHRHGLLSPQGLESCHRSRSAFLSHPLTCE